MTRRRSARRHRLRYKLNFLRSKTLAYLKRYRWLALIKITEVVTLLIPRSATRPSRIKTCISCGKKNVISVRSDARLCSDACRSREYRKRKKRDAQLAQYVRDAQGV